MNETNIAINRIEIEGGKYTVHHQSSDLDISWCLKLVASTFLTIFTLLGSAGRQDTYLLRAPASEADNIGR